jgi:hypothetical protein
MPKIELHRTSGLRRELEYHALKKGNFSRCRNSRENRQVRKYYKKYCNLLIRVINQAKKW